MDEDFLISLFCMVDDFCIQFEPEWQKIQRNQNTTSGRWWTTRESKMILSELMTVAILFHYSGYRTFKDYYIYFVLPHLTCFFPNLVTYKHFNKLMKKLVLPLFALQKTLAGKSEGIAFIDSTILSVCHICRASSHKVFKDIAKKGKSTTGWFFGMKLHLLINHRSEIVSWMLTPGNTDDRTPVPELLKGIFGKVYGDRGYISKNLFEDLYERGIQLITRLRTNMKNMLMDTFDRLVLYKRGIIECVNNRLKLGCQIEHHRHRSHANFLVNLIAGLACYSVSSKKPFLDSLGFKKSIG
jgi:hypothetical protein